MYTRQDTCLQCCMEKDFKIDIKSKSTHVIKKNQF